jgi:hypothetical protein
MPWLVEIGIVLLAFGYYLSAPIAILLDVDSRPINIVYRALVVLCFLLPFIFSPLIKQKLSTPEILLYFFWLFYMLRIAVDIHVYGISYNTGFTKGLTTSFIYLLTLFNIVLPLITVFRYRSLMNYDRVYRYSIWFLSFCVLLVLFSILTSQQFQNRLAYARFSLGSDGAATLNPIRISFIGYMGVMTAVFLLVFRKLSISKSFFWYLIALASGFCLFIGGSRGPFLLLALSLSLIIYLRFRAKSSFLYKFRLAIIIGIFATVGISYMVQNADDLLVLNRLADTLERVQEGKSEERNLLYTVGWNQFLESPVIGSSFLTQSSDLTIDRVIVHNFFLESMMAVGILGSLFLLIPLFFLFKKIFLILKYSQGEQYFLLLTLGSLVQALISGSVILDVEFWVLFVFCLTFNIIKNKYVRNIRSL